MPAGQRALRPLSGLSGDSGPTVPTSTREGASTGATARHSAPAHRAKDAGSGVGPKLFSSGTTRTPFTTTGLRKLGSDVEVTFDSHACPADRTRATIGPDPSDTRASIPARIFGTRTLIGSPRKPPSGVHDQTNDLPLARQRGSTAARCLM